MGAQAKRETQAARVRDVTAKYTEAFSAMAEEYTRLKSSGSSYDHPELNRTITSRFPTVLVVVEHSNYETTVSLLPRPVRVADLSPYELAQLETGLDRGTYYPSAQMLSAVFTGYSLGLKHGRAQVRDAHDPDVRDPMRPRMLGFR